MADIAVVVAGTAVVKPGTVVVTRTGIVVRMFHSRHKMVSDSGFPAVRREVIEECTSQTLH